MEIVFNLFPQFAKAHKIVGKVEQTRSTSLFPLAFTKTWEDKNTISYVRARFGLV